MKIFDELVNEMPDEVLSASGAIFYSAPPAFEGCKPIYILGLNPGGNPAIQADNTVRKNYDTWQRKVQPWSEYVDEIWEGSMAGEHGMQPRIRHLADSININLRFTPSSNVIFVRSATEKKLQADKEKLISACWPVHQAVIEGLGCRVILCLGRTAGDWVRKRLGANELRDQFKEKNKRGWMSSTHRSAQGIFVCTLTHPGRADWRNPDADPSPMVKRVIEASGI